MAEDKKEHGFIDGIKGGLSYISQVISRAVLSGIFPPIEEGAERVMKSIEDRMMQIEKRVMRRVSSLLIIWFGGVFLAFSLLFFLIQSLGWSNAAAFFSIGITVFVIGLMLRSGGSDRNQPQDASPVAIK